MSHERRIINQTTVTPDFHSITPLGHDLGLAPGLLDLRLTQPQVVVAIRMTGHRIMPQT
jgi:hypothetical protein